jgi:hypothetical protein
MIAISSIVSPFVTPAPTAGAVLQPHRANIVPEGWRSMAKTKRGRSNLLIGLEFASSLLPSTSH